MKARFLKRLEKLEAMERARARALSPLPFIELDYICNRGNVNGHEVTLEEAEEAEKRITPEQHQRAKEEGHILILVITLNGERRVVPIDRPKHEQEYEDEDDE